jgi:MoaA/NifB/PqqE/SkfB family radical SAM enzyme
MDEIANVGKPVIILTGGEPLLRTDIFDLARYGSSKGFRMVMATNGTLITEETIPKDGGQGFKESALASTAPMETCLPKVSVPLSPPGIEMAKRELQFQINTTITQANLHLISDILHLLCLSAIAITSSSWFQQEERNSGQDFCP